MEEINKTGYPSVDKPWLQYYNQELINAPLPKGSIYQYMYENNKGYLNDVAIEFFDQKITYRKLFKNIQICAKALIANGVKAGDIVTIALPSIPEVLYIVYAVNKIGAVANMIHPLAGENEIISYLNEVKSDVFIMFTGTYDIIEHTLHKTNVKRAVVISPVNSLPSLLQKIYNLKKQQRKIPFESVFVAWDKFIKMGENVQQVDFEGTADDIAVISHTGGTTGEPKGVMLTNYNINAEIWQIGCNLPHKRQERTLVVLPPFINYSLVNGMLEPLAFGFTAILIPDYKTLELGKYIKKYKPNHINSIPTYLEALLEIEDIKTMDLSCLKYVVYGGDAMNQKNEEAVNELILSRGAQLKISKGLGATELVSAATISYPECNIIGSVGIPLVKMNCKIINPDTNEELSYNEEGEICFTGPNLMVGYYDKKDETNRIIHIHSDNNRWLHTGDLGYITETGILYICGRIKRIIATKGLDGMPTKMFPDRIESVILKHPAVSLCCVVGVADEDRINYPKATVVLKEKKEKQDVVTNEILELCKIHLPKYMWPEKIIYMEDLPRTTRGKIDYRALEHKN
ncbi:MAG: acyl--CoA ligase [Ruminococcaceae bacterium]|nr:acyl--CoA ligase [Oscillospiraceae bacterium]